MSTKKKAPKKKAPKKKVPQEKRTEIYILRKFPNPRWLLGEGIDGTAVRVESPKYNADKLVHKTIPVVECVDAAGEKYYKYAP